MANIKQVAAHAGLSVACVSKYLKNASSVLPASREKIETAIRELRYTPSKAARSLRTKRNHTIKVVLDSITNPFFAEIFETLRRVLESQGYTAVLQSVIRPFVPADIDGIDGILVGFSSNEKRLAELIYTAESVPVVLLHWREPLFSVPSVWSDVRCGMELATKHLLEAGCHRIAYVGGPTKDAISETKYEGAQGTLATFGLKLRPDWVFHGDFVFQSGYDAAQRISDKNNHPDGILCENDVLAAGVICGLHQQGIMVPEQIRVVGFDNIPLADMYIPSITSVALPTTAMCERAAYMIIALVKSSPISSCSYPPRLILRQS